MPRSRLVAFRIVATALALGCPGDPPTAPVIPPSGPVKIADSFYPSGIFPGEETILTVTVTAPDGQAVTGAKVVFSGLVVDFMMEIPGQDRLLVFGQPVFSLVDLSPGGVVPAARY
jgi:hypothetical protein